MMDFDADNRGNYKTMLKKSDNLIYNDGPLKTQYAWVHQNCGLFNIINTERILIEVTPDFVFDYTLFDYQYASCQCSVCLK